MVLTRLFTRDSYFYADYTEVHMWVAI